MDLAQLPAPPTDPVAHWDQLPRVFLECLNVIAGHCGQPHMNRLQPASLATTFFRENFRRACGRDLYCGFQRSNEDTYSAFIQPEDDPELVAAFIAMFGVPDESTHEQLKHFLRAPAQDWLVCLHHYFSHGAYPELQPHRRPYRTP
jgi:hypothetical protein